MPTSQIGRLSMRSLLRALKRQGFEVTDEGLTLVVKGPRGDRWNFPKATVIHEGDGHGYRNMVKRLEQMGFVSPTVWERLQRERRKEQKMETVFKPPHVEEASSQGQDEPLQPAQSWPCPSCGKVFTSAQGVTMHRTRVHDYHKGDEKARPEGVEVQVGVEPKVSSKVRRRQVPYEEMGLDQRVRVRLHKLTQALEVITTELPALLEDVSRQAHDKEVNDAKLRDLSKLLGRAVDVL